MVSALSSFSPAWKVYSQMHSRKQVAHAREMIVLLCIIVIGTERCNEAITKLGGKYDIVVNIQGDEPLIEPEIIDEVAETLKNSPDAVYR